MRRLLPELQQSRMSLAAVAKCVRRLAPPDSRMTPLQYLRHDCIEGRPAARLAARERGGVSLRPNALAPAQQGSPSPAADPFLREVQDFMERWDAQRAQESCSIIYAACRCMQRACSAQASRSEAGIWRSASSRSWPEATEGAQAWGSWGLPPAFGLEVAYLKRTGAPPLQARSPRSPRSPRSRVASSGRDKQGERKAEALTDPCV